MAYHWSHKLATNKQTPGILSGGDRFIYLVAGSRNIESCSSHGGLFVNVGQTDRDVNERLSDSDYSRKNGSGTWIILAQWTVPNWISDHDVHEILRTKEGISWGNETNTEEFFFAGETADAKTAKLIVESAICCAIMNGARSLFAGAKDDKIIPAIPAPSKPYTTAGFDAVSSKWRDIAERETIWRKKAQSNLAQLKEIPSVEDIAWRFSFSLITGLVLVGLSLAVKPPALLMLLVFCPILSSFAVASEVWWLRKMIAKGLLRAKNLD